jgi:iron-sulfur cluster repair protein YtfE (RIC family)
MKLSPERALAELEAQHAGLRAIMERCDELLVEVEAGRCGPIQLTREVARLRLAFEGHNRFEEQLLRPLLRQTDPFAAARIERMIEEHVNEHRAMAQQLGSKDTADLRDVIETLRAHLDAEERYLLAPSVLREQPIS